MCLCVPTVYLRKGSFWQWCVLALVAAGAVRGAAQQAGAGKAQANVAAGQASPADNAPTVPVAGSVSDPSGALIPGATLHFAPLKDPAQATAGTATGKDAVTDGAGHFNVTLAPGNYTLSVAAEGFTDLSRELVVGPAPASLALHLAIATTSEGVDVP